MTPPKCLACHEPQRRSGDFWCAVCRCTWWGSLGEPRARWESKVGPEFRWGRDTCTEYRHVPGDCACLRGDSGTSPHRFPRATWLQALGAEGSWAVSGLCRCVLGMLLRHGGWGKEGGPTGSSGGTGLAIALTEARTAESRQWRWGWRGRWRLKTYYISRMRGTQSPWEAVL